MSGPIASAKTTVPTPIVPPKSQPTIKTTSSMPVRHSRIERPVTRASPVIRPSRGPGPRWAPMYIPVAIPHRSTPAVMHPTRASHPDTCGSSARLMFIDVPTRTTLLTVPSPGRWRSGIHSSSTAAPTMITSVPIARPASRASPWWKTSHGSRPRPERTWSAPDSP